MKIKSLLKKRWKKLDGIVANAGSIKMNISSFSSEKDFYWYLKNNFITAFKFVNYFLDDIKKNKGSIVLFSTVAIKQGFPNHAIVASAKGAVEGLTISLAAEFAPKIKVNCIAPSLTDAKMTQKLISNETIKKAIENKFNVTVTKVNLLNVKGKMKRGGKGKLTKRTDWKKAYISLKNEDRIEISQD